MKLATCLLLTVGIATAFLTKIAWSQEPVPKVDEATVRKAELNMLRSTVKRQAEQIKKLKAENVSLVEQVKQIEELCTQHGIATSQPAGRPTGPTPLEQIAVLNSKVAELETENAMVRATLRALTDLQEKRGGGEVKVVPVVGDETSLVKVKANPRDYVGKEFILVGGLKVIDYYNYGYGEAKRTHVSLSLREVRADGTYTQNDISLYLSRSVSKKLVEAITKVVAGGYGAKLVRAKVTILPHRYEEGESMMAEMLDWQFRNAAGTGWRPYALRSDRAPGAKPKSRKQ